MKWYLSFVFLLLPTLVSAQVFFAFPVDDCTLFAEPKVILYQEADTGKTVEMTVSNDLDALLAWTELTDSDPAYADKSFPEHFLSQLNSTATQVIPQNSSYTDPGANASDVVNGQGISLTSSIIKTGTINTATLAHRPSPTPSPMQEGSLPLCPAV